MADVRSLASTRPDVIAPRSRPAGRHARRHPGRRLLAILVASAVAMSGGLALTSGSASAVSAGNLAIFAGTGTAGAPVAGAATSSPLNDPQGVAVDGAGNTYIADAAS